MRVGAVYEVQILLTVAEHHSNLVPWQILAQKTGAVLRFVNLTPEETLDLKQLKEFLNERTKLVSTFHVSNTLGAHPAFLASGSVKQH